MTMEMEKELEFGPPVSRYPARHRVMDAVLARAGERIPVVVKKTRTDWRQRLSGETKAERSEATARALLARGLPTPEPLGVEVRDGESWYVARRVDGAQIRQWFLERDDSKSASPPAIPFNEVVGALAGLARSMHDSGVFFRDFTDGNVLVGGAAGAVRLWLVDLNRARIGAEPLGMWSRFRDLARPGLNRLEDRKFFLARYFGQAEAPAGALLAVSLLRARIVSWDALKKALRPWKW
jgi:hypothetical protein